MTTRKLASHLCMFVADWANVERNETEGGYADLAERQLRALLAVARAARRVPNSHTKEDDRLDRALDRLERLSTKETKP